MVAGMGFEPHDLRVMRTSVLVLISSILESKKQVFFVFADVLSMLGVGGGSTNLPILSSLSQRYFQTVSPSSGMLPFLFQLSSLHLQISANFLYFLKSFARVSVSMAVDRSNMVVSRKYFLLGHPAV